MNGRNLNSDGDIYVSGTGVSRCSSYAETVILNIRTQMKTFEGECFSDEDAGVPWYDDVLGVSTSALDNIRQEIREKIESVEGVDKITSMSMSVNKRKMSGSYTVSLDDGTTASGTY